MFIYGGCRKLAEVGFKRDAEKCKEKFEEESSKYFNNISYSKSYGPLSELDEVCNGENPHLAVEKNQRTEKHSEEDDNMVQNTEEDSRNETEGNFPLEDSKKLIENPTKDKKRKRHQKFEIFKSFCEDVVNKFMAQQEEMHNKLIEDMVRREAEFIAREEARKKEEMERLNKELEIMAHQQAVAGDRQATITEYLKKLSEASEKQQCFVVRSNEDQPLSQVPNTSILSSSSSLAQNPSLSPQIDNQNINNLEAPTSSAGILDHAGSSSPLVPQILASANPSSSHQEQNHQNPKSSSDDQNRNPTTPTSFSIKKSSQIAKSNDKDETGKRWPKDEVLALINLRCNLNNTNHEEKEGTSRLPIWERISQGMLELGYKRSAKRCKEKWENINKYFRKTRDVNKKRSVDSRTCPYFHHLSSLYDSGKLAATSEEQENSSTLPENSPGLPENSLSSSQGWLSESTKHGAAGEKNAVHQVSAGFDFEY